MRYKTEKDLIEGQKEQQDSSRDTSHIRQQGNEKCEEISRRKTTVSPTTLWNAVIRSITVYFIYPVPLDKLHVLLYHLKLPPIVQKDFSAI